MCAVTVREYRSEIAPGRSWSRRAGTRAQHLALRRSAARAARRPAALPATRPQRARLAAGAGDGGRRCFMACLALRALGHVDVDVLPELAHEDVAVVAHAPTAATGRSRCGARAPCTACRRPSASWPASISACALGAVGQHALALVQLVEGRQVEARVVGLALVGAVAERQERRRRRAAPRSSRRPTSSACRRGWPSGARATGRSSELDAQADRLHVASATARSAGATAGRAEVAYSSSSGWPSGCSRQPSPSRST